MLRRRTIRRIVAYRRPSRCVSLLIRSPTFERRDADFIAMLRRQTHLQYILALIFRLHRQGSRSRPARRNLAVYWLGFTRRHLCRVFFQEVRHESPGLGLTLFQSRTSRRQFFSLSENS